MKKLGPFLFAVFMAAGLLGFAGTSEAAPNLIGTWAGQVQCAGISSFWTQNLEFTVQEQWLAAGLFRGTMYDRVITGYISGTTVRMNEVKLTNIEFPPSSWSYWDAKYVASSTRKLTGYYRDSAGSTCSFIFKKQKQ